MLDGHADVTDRILGCALEVHRHLGPGLLESVYESAMCIELRSRGISFKRQFGVPLYYKGELISEHLPDLTDPGRGATSVTVDAQGHPTSVVDALGTVTRGTYDAAGNLIVEERVVVEVKSLERLAPIHLAQILTYLRVTSLKVGLLLNFNSPTMRAGTRRVVLKA